MSQKGRIAAGRSLLVPGDPVLRRQGQRKRIRVTSDVLRKPIWNRSHYLDRMTLKELWIAYFQYPAILTYLALSLLCVGVWFAAPAPALPTLSASGIIVLLYPLVWYALHRWVLHSNWMFKIPLLASTWKRIHYDHHQDPNRLEVLFGALHTTLPTIAAIALPVGYAIGGVGGAAAAFGAGLLTTCVYEFVHCIQHLAYKPRWKLVAEMKKRHMAHHFHDERGNYGITNYFWDRAFGTFYDRRERPEKSATVFNLGYTPEVAQRYPWVARLSGGVAAGHPRRRHAASQQDRA
jgi:sterol desaturase/sphingolipid hydroxylase (fatty acid hydroxylase superfamily)